MNDGGATVDRGAHRFPVANVCPDNLHIDPVEVGKARANARIEHDDLGAPAHEIPHYRGTNEAGAAGHENPLVGQHCWA